ncbi:MAG: hypothetical protein PHO32_09865, partial [Candidatus Cloacimonetes bacterium]|nr:hypothetical protein [Candidatus Cloacimonadota bacterium]
SYKADYPQASIIRLNYLYYMALYDEALQWAETILNQSLAVHHHAKAFLTMGMIDFKLEDYPSAIGTLKRVYSLFPEFPDIRRAAAYHIIKSMIQTSQLTEASMHLTNYAVDLNQQQRLELNQLLER